MKTLTKKLGILALMAGLGMMGNACSKKKSRPSAAAHGGGGIDAEGDPSETVEDEFASSYGVMNFRQLAATYQSLTGVTLDNGTVLEEYEKQIAGLPKSSDPAAISAAKVSATTKLAASYCDVLSQDDGLLTARVGDTIANLGAMDPSELATETLAAFYGPETALQGKRSDDVAIVAGLVTDLRAVGGATPAAVFMGVCSAVLSSAEFVLY